MRPDFSTRSFAILLVLTARWTVVVEKIEVEIDEVVVSAVPQLQLFAVPNGKVRRFVCAGLSLVQIEAWHFLHSSPKEDANQAQSNFTPASNFWHQSRIALKRDPSVVDSLL
jgi:hypothetical protein